MSLDIGSIVRVTAQIAPQGVLRRDFGRTLFLTVDDTLGVSGADRVQTFASMDDVAAVFEPDSKPYKAAAIYFQQEPYPRNLLVARWVADAKPTVITGRTPASLDAIRGRATVVTGTGTVAEPVNFYGRETAVTGTGTVASLATLQGITAGTVTFVGQTVTGIDFSGATDLDGVASVLQTDLRATNASDLAAVEVEYDSAAAAFVVTLPLDANGAAVSVSAAFTGAEADDLGLDTATIVAGVDSIKSGTVTFAGETATGIDFSAVTDYDDVASVLQTALRGATGTTLDAVEVVYDGDATTFVVAIPLAADGSATAVTAAFSGAEADELGLDTATIVDGVDAIQSGTVTFLGETFSDIDFTDVESLADVASTLQTALRTSTAAGFSEAEVEYDALQSAFAVSIDRLDADEFLAGDTADDLGLDGGSIAAGYASETIEAALADLLALDSDWYFTVPDSAIRDGDGARALAAWTASRPYMLALDVTGADVLEAGEDDSLAAELSALGYDNAFAVWSQTEDHKALSLAGRLSAINFAAANSLLTAKFKVLPGTTPDALTTTQQEELIRKRINYYAPFGGDAIVAEGMTLKPGRWIDTQYWLDWLINAIRTSVYNLLRQSARVPQTARGVAAIKAVVQRVCEEGVRNGGIAPGFVTEALRADIIAVTGNGNFSGRLTRGYLVHAGSIAEQAQSDREQRKAPPARVWLKHSGAVHTVDIALTLEQ